MATLDRRSTDVVFNKILPAIITAALLWVGSQVQNLTNGLTKLTVEVTVLQKQMEKLQNTQYPRTDIERELERFEKRINALEQRYRTSSP